MKFLITSDCFLKSGELAQTDQVIEVSTDEAKSLKLAGRGYPAPAEPEPAPAQQEKPVKAKK